MTSHAGVPKSDAVAVSAAVRPARGETDSLSLASIRLVDGCGPVSGRARHSTLCLNGSRPGLSLRQASWMSVFRPRNWLDRLFVVGIIGKGLNGTAELLGGLLLLFLTPGQIQHVAVSWTRGELSEDPHDFIATHLLHTANGLTGSAVLFGAIYLLAHGLVKVVLVVALLLNKLWAYPWMIVVLLLFIGYQLYRIVLNPTAGLIALTVFDVVVVALTWREYLQQRRDRHSPSHRRSVRAGGAASTQAGR